jgi:hypothetical protein
MVRHKTIRKRVFPEKKTKRRANMDLKGLLHLLGRKRRSGTIENQVMTIWMKRIQPMI